jgi:hypothetical protein
MKKLSALSKSIAVSDDKETRNSNMPNQYARVKNVVKGEDVIKDITDQTYAFVDEFLEEAMNSSSIYEADEDLVYEYWSSNHNTHATLLRVYVMLRNVLNVYVHFSKHYLYEVIIRDL